MRAAAIMDRVARNARLMAAALKSDPACTVAAIKNVPAFVRGAQLADHWPLAASTQPTDRPNRLREYFDAHLSGPGIWKWEHYFDIYDRHLERFIGVSPQVVEIGIYSGGSLGMWLDYFGPGSRVHGIDIEPACTEYASEQVAVHIGDQQDRSFWADFRNEAPTVDIVIDDGGHTDQQQMVTLEELLVHLRPGGVFICEDIHGKNRRFVAFAQGLVDRLNHQTSSAPGEVLASQTSVFQRAIHSVHFYPYMTVIEKHRRGPVEFKAPKHGTEWQPFYDR